VEMMTNFQGRDRNINEWERQEGSQDGNRLPLHRRRSGKKKKKKEKERKMGSLDDDVMLCRGGET
jgi:hypothetical protein